VSNGALDKGRVNDRRMISRVIHVFKSGRKRNDASEGRFEKRTAFYRPNPGYPDRAPRFPKAAVRPPFGNFGVELGSLTTPDD
jgi:hypothetical protein